MRHRRFSTLSPIVTPLQQSPSTAFQSCRSNSHPFHCLSFTPFQLSRVHCASDATAAVPFHCAVTPVQQSPVPLPSTTPVTPLQQSPSTAFRCASHATPTVPFDCLPLRQSRHSNSPLPLPSTAPVTPLQQSPSTAFHCASHATPTVPLPLPSTALGSRGRHRAGCCVSTSLVLRNTDCCDITNKH